MKKIIKNTLELIGLYGISIVVTISGLLTPGKKGKLKRLEAKILRNQANNKLIPFVDKYRSCMKIDSLLHKEFELYNEVEKDERLKEETNANKKRKINSKRTLNIVGGVGKFVSLYTLESMKATITPGIKGKYKRNEMKILNTGIVYKFTPFGDKKYQEKKLDILEKKSEVYYQIDSIDNLSKEELIKLRNKCLNEINELDKQEKQLKKVKRR